MKKDVEKESKYKEIIKIEWPLEKSIMPKMSLKERAKIFLPFAALKGYEEALEKVANEKESNVLEQKL